MVTVHHLTHAQAMKNRDPRLPDSQCPGKLKKRLFKSSLYRECVLCGTKVTFDWKGVVFIAAAPETAAECLRRAEERDRKEVADVSVRGSNP